MRFLYTDEELNEIKSAYEKIRAYFDVMADVLRSPISLQIDLYDSEFRLIVQPYYNVNYPKLVKILEWNSSWSYDIVGHEAHESHSRSPLDNIDGLNGIVAIIHNWQFVTDEIEKHLDEQAKILDGIHSFNVTMENV